MNRMIGGTLGIAVIGAVFASMAPDGVRDPGAFVDAFTSSMWVATGVTVLGAGIAIALLRGKAEREPQVAQAEAATTAQGSLATGELEQVPA
jgi:hypothetical protein